jgi:uncharacterized protein (DUF1684 family)
VPPALPALFIVLALACTSRPPEDPRSYAAHIDAARAEKDAAFNSAPDAEPVPISRRAELLPLAYFPVDPAYTVPAVLQPNGDRAAMIMPTSTGGQRQMRRVGSLGFTLKGQPFKLTAFVEADAPNVDHLFVPFTDLTSGTETYPGGRYLDLDRNATGLYVIDFNRAYHPFCYYNPSYDCPFPPAENRLKIPIRAGERVKKPKT